MWRWRHLNSLYIIAVMVSGSFPLFAQTHRVGDSAAPPCKERAGGTEPPELRHRRISLQLLLTPLLLFCFVFFKKVNIIFYRINQNKQQHPSPLQEVLLYWTDVSPEQQDSRSSCPLGQQAWGMGTARREPGPHAACCGAGWGGPNTSGQDMTTGQGQAGTAQDWC